jgi:hypothetical protein
MGCKWSSVRVGLPRQKAKGSEELPFHLCTLPIFYSANGFTITTLAVPIIWINDWRSITVEKQLLLPGEFLGNWFILKLFKRVRRHLNRREKSKAGEQPDFWLIANILLASYGAMGAMVVREFITPQA